jgi:beta-glucosidase
MYQPNSPQFPADFIFGVADADLQVIGEAACLKEEGAEETMWLDFSRQKGKVWGGHTTLEGVDRYHRWREDIELLKRLNVKHYRTSVSMSRVLRSDGSINQQAIDWYNRYFGALREAGISVYATVYHWELPNYLSRAGGWKNRATVDHVVTHGTVVARELGSYIDELFVLNEPFQSTFDSYFTGVHAPGETDIKGAVMAVHNILLAQGRTTRAIREALPRASISTVYNPSVTYSATTEPQDVEAAIRAWEFHTGIFTEPLYRGEYPEFVLKRFGDLYPVTLANDLEEMRVGNQLNAFGVNYYRGKLVERDVEHPFGFREVRYPQGIVNGLGWPVFVAPTYPEGFYDLLTELHRRYEAYGMKALYITENGTCWEDSPNAKGDFEDDFRIFYLREHLAQVHKAILAHVPVKGYFAWTLLDNFEWDLGYRPESCFGLVHVDRESMKRTPKKSFAWYCDLIESKTLG